MVETNKRTENWIVSSNNIEYNNDTTWKETSINEVLSNCEIYWYCEGCKVGNNSDSIIRFSNTQQNVVFTKFEYTVIVNSYSGTDKISGVVVNDKSKLFIGPDFSKISLITSQTVFNNNGEKSIGFSLDYESTNVGSTITLNNYNNSIISSSNSFIDNKIIVNSFDKNVIGVDLKLSRNSNWLIINQSTKNSLFLIFFQLVSIIISIFGLSKIALNLMTKKRVLRVLLCIFCQGKGSGKAVVERVVKVGDGAINTFLPGSISYPGNGINNHINNFSNMCKNNSIEMTEINNV